MTAVRARAPRPRAAAAQKAAASSSGSSKSSAPKLTVDEMVANSILSKEELLGRSLDDAERADITAKLKATGLWANTVFAFSGDNGGPESEAHWNAGEH